MSELNAYILGTDEEELDRLELQHRVWASEARKGWNNAEFKKGHTVLDLGCGPGSCSIELADIVGSNGKVIAKDTPNNLIRNIDAQNAYFGDSFKIN